MARVGNLRLLIGDRADIGAGLVVPAAFRRAQVVRWPPGSGSDEGIEELADVDWLHLVGQSTRWLGRFASHATLATRRVTMVVESWRKPQPGWSGRVGALPGLVRHEVRLPTGNTGRAVVDLTLAEPTPVGEIIEGALDALVPRLPMPSMVSADVVAGDRVPRQRPVPPDVEPARVLLDSSVVNPIGRSGVDRIKRAQLRFDAGGTNWSLWMERDDEPEVVAAGRLDKLPPDDDQLVAIRSVGVIECQPELSGDPAGAAALLAQIASTGVVLHADTLPWTIDEHLSSELSKAIKSPLPEPLSDPIEWEFRSVSQRRAALRNHAAGLRSMSASNMHRVVSQLPTVSALLVTMRPHELPKVIAAVAGQTYPELEIVVGLHGCALAPEVERVADSCGRPVEIVDIPKAFTLGEALGAATARARGDLVTKVDDDDVYGPEHVWDLVIAREFSGATLVGKGAEFVFLEALGVTVRRTSMTSEAYTTVVAGGTIMLSRGDLAAVGGWRPVPNSVDRALFGRVQRDGGLIYRTHPLGFVYRRHANGHTWDPGLEYFLRGVGPQWSGLPPFAEFVGGGR